MQMDKRFSDCFVQSISINSYIVACVMRDKTLEKNLISQGDRIMPAIRLARIDRTKVFIPYIRVFLLAQSMC